MKKWEKELLTAMLVAVLTGGTTAWGQPGPGKTPPATAPKAAAPAAAKATTKVNVNTADEGGLMSLKGIGKVKAKAIIDYRQKNGPFKTVDDLAKVEGIGEKTLNDLRDQLTVE
jgi:competence protein ComEA